MEVNSTAWFECPAMEDRGRRVRLASYISPVKEKKIKLRKSVAAADVVLWLAFANVQQKLSGKFENRKGGWYF